VGAEVGEEDEGHGLGGLEGREGLLDGGRLV